MIGYSKDNNEENEVYATEMDSQKYQDSQYLESEENIYNDFAFK